LKIENQAQNTKRKKKTKDSETKIFHSTEENTRKNPPQILREEFCFIDLMKMDTKASTKLTSRKKYSPPSKTQEKFIRKMFALK